MHSSPPLLAVPEKLLSVNIDIEKHQGTKQITDPAPNAPQDLQLKKKLKSSSLSKSTREYPQLGLSSLDGNPVWRNRNKTLIRSRLAAMRPMKERQQRNHGLTLTRLVIDTLRYLTAISTTTASFERASCLNRHPQVARVDDFKNCRRRMNRRESNTAEGLGGEHPS